MKLEMYEPPKPEGGPKRVVEPNLDTLSLARGKQAPDTVTPWLVVVRPAGAFVLLVINDKCATLDTTRAFDVGVAVIRLARECAENELVIVTINNERICLTVQQAMNLGKGLCRKADDADDFQRKHNLRILK